MKAVLLSIQPKWCRLIAEGKKTVEVRKNVPKLGTPFKCYIYMTKFYGKAADFGGWETAYLTPDGDYKDGCQKVIGEFICRGIEEYWFTKEDADIEEYEDVQLSCLTSDEILAYGKEKPLYFWDISSLIIYEQPKKLSEFVVEGDCSCDNCGKCKWLDKGNGHNVEDDCLLPYDYDFKTVKPLFRAPQSWCYVEELEG